MIERLMVLIALLYFLHHVYLGAEEVVDRRLDIANHARWLVSVSHKRRHLRRSVSEVLQLLKPILSARAAWSNIRIEAPIKVVRQLTPAGLLFLAFLFHLLVKSSDTVFNPVHLSYFRVQAVLHSSAALALEVVGLTVEVGLSELGLLQVGEIVPGGTDVALTVILRAGQQEFEMCAQFIFDSSTLVQLRVEINSLLQPLVFLSHQQVHFLLQSDHLSRVSGRARLHVRQQLSLELLGLHQLTSHGVKLGGD